MSYQRSFDGSRLVELPPPCLHLRNKAMYVRGEPDPRSPEEMGNSQFNCWCNKTQHTMGPDQTLVNRTTCVEGRECFDPRA